MEQDDLSTLISQLNDLKSFHDFWSINNTSITLADFHVFQARYKTIDFNSSRDDKFLFKEPITEEEISIIESHRIPFISNPLIKGLYCDVLATILGKGAFVQAEESIRCYLEVLSNYSRYDQRMILGVIVGCTLSILNYNKDRKQITNILQAYLHDETIDIDIRRIVLCFLYDTRFSKASECQTIIDGETRWLEISNHYKSNKYFLSHALVLAQATNKPIEYRNLLYHRLAENEEIIISQHPLDSFAVQELIDKAEYLEAGHWYEEAKECRKLITIAKENGDGIVTIRYKAVIPNTMFPQYSKFFVDVANPFEIIANEDSLLPNGQSVIQSDNDDGLPPGIRKTQIDYNGNPHPMKKSIEQQMRSYSNQYEMDSLAPMLVVIRDLIAKKSFTYTQLANYLKKTWIGRPRCLVNAALRQSQESWLDLLKPSLKMLCREIQKQLTKESHKADFVCCLDSLTVKLEGCIRDIARIYGLRTIDKEHNELLLGSLLEQIDESIMPLKTIQLLNAMLKPDGRNLRNNFAHGFSSLADYNFNNAFALLHCLLRISTVQM